MNRSMIGPLMVSSEHDFIVYDSPGQLLRSEHDTHESAVNALQSSIGALERSHFSKQLCHDRIYRWDGEEWVSCPHDWEED